MYEYQATPTYVVDGDTLDMTVDLGFHIHVTDRFRLRGLNTPERGKPGYAEAKAFVAHAVLGQTVRVETRLDAADKYGRMLADVHYNDPANGLTYHLNQELLDAGLAVPYMQ